MGVILQKNKRVYFICDICGIEASKPVKFFDNTQEKILCGNCQRKETNLKRYGVDNPSKSSLIKDKRKETNLKRYGVDNPSKSSLIKDRIKNAMLEKYGVEHALQHKPFFEKMQNTNLKRYGFSVAVKNDEIKKKATVATLSGMSKKSLEKKAINQKITNFDKIIKRVKNVTPLFTIDEYYGVERTHVYEWECTLCKTRFFDHLDEGRNPRCPKCFPGNSSSGEIELRNAIGKFTEVIANKKFCSNTYEIDVFLPEYNIGVEYHGLYYHSIKFINMYYHFNKYIFFKNKGVQLIQIFEDEWSNNKTETLEYILSVMRNEPINFYEKYDFISNELYYHDNRFVGKKMDNFIGFSAPVIYINDVYNAGYSIYKRNML